MCSVGRAYIHVHLVTEVHLFKLLVFKELLLYILRLLEIEPASFQSLVQTVQPIVFQVGLHKVHVCFERFFFWVRLAGITLFEDFEEIVIIIGNLCVSHFRPIVNA